MPRSFEAAVRRHQRTVFTFAAYFLGSRQEAEDVAQEVLIRMWRHWHRLDPERLRGWLLRVTRNACYDVLRKRRSVAAVMASDDDGEAPERAAGSLPDPESAAESSGLRQRISDAVARLEEPHRSIVILREIQGYKYREIAEALEMPLNTVKVYLHRARQALREELREELTHAPL